MPENPPDPRPWEAVPKWPRRAITAWLLFHLFAVVSAPASVAPASQLARAGWSLCRPYLQVLYLNHGYHYFAPDPGESTLLAFTVERDDGTRIRDAIPNRRIWPRLLYHRHFMLTESLAFITSVSESMFGVDPLAEEDGEDAESADATSASGDSRQNVGETGDPLTPGSADEQPPAEIRGLLRDWYRSYALCLLNKYEGQRVHLVRVVHYLPEMEWMQESIARGQPLHLSEPQSFAEFPIGTFDRLGNLIDDAPPPASWPAPPVRLPPAGQDAVGGTTPSEPGGDRD